MPDDISRSTLLLDALSRSPAGLSTTELVAELAEPVSRAQALAKYGTILRRFVRDGLAEDAGVTEGAYRRPPVRVWQITAAGRVEAAKRRFDLRRAEGLQADLPLEAVRAAAEVRLRQYGSEYSAGHLTWEDFADEVREVLTAALPFLQAQATAEPGRDAG
jgi:DNA-binding PadR family transcriptional regulator